MSRITELSQLAAVINVNDETKNVGIGTSNPESKLSVGGNLTVSGNITAVSFYGDGSNLTGLSTFSGNYDDLINKPEISSIIVGLASEGYVDSKVGLSTSGLASVSYVNNSIVGFITSGTLIGYATEGYVNNSIVGFITSGTLIGYATEGYVNTSVANLVASAPETLNTLNELATALGNDANFSTTITNSLSGKANLIGANFTGIVTATSFYGDGSNLSNIISGVGIATESGIVGTGATILDFRGAGISTVIVSSGIATINITGGGIPTETPTKTETNFVATSEQTSFSVNYEVGYIEVYLNGIRLSSSEYVATSGTEVILVEPTSQGDVVDVIEIATTGPMGPQGPQGETTLSGVTTTASSSIHYPVFIAGLGSTSPYISTTSNYFTFVPSSGTLTTNQLNVIGNVTATDFNSTSDINFKENIKIIENPIDKVLQIKGVTFNWKENQQSSAGVIAQDIEKILPEIVKEKDDKKSLNYNGLIGLLVEAVKKQQEQINILTTRIEKLEGN